MTVSKRVWTLVFPLGGGVLSLLPAMVAAAIYVAGGGQPDAAGAFSFSPIVTAPFGAKTAIFTRRIILSDISDLRD